MTKSAKDFIQAAHDNEDLRIEIENVGQDVSALITLAKSKGYEFDADDLNATIRELGYSLDESLSDEDLAQVAGGGNSTQSEACTSWPQC